METIQSEVIFNIVIAIIFLILTGFLFTLISRWINKFAIDSPKKTLFCSYLIAGIFVSFYIIGVLIVGKGDFIHFGFNFDNFVLFLPYSVILGSIIGLFTCLQLFYVIKYNESLLIIKPKKDKSEFLNACIVYFIMVPLGEELFFRGFIQSLFMDIFPQKIMILFLSFSIGTIITAVIFWIFHTINITIKSLKNVIQTIFSVFIPAFILGFIYQLSQNVFNTIIIHSLSIGLYVLLSYILVFKNIIPERIKEDSIIA
ncbi:MAG: CPBP family intramembrane metalloprotease [Candidatus Lokiarchaeota archaeon]|nr:CPBP family intramembrane metalloprotease [Candidatus Lokiarchaeota archaeon]